MRLFFFDLNSDMQLNELQGIKALLDPVKSRKAAVRWLKEQGFQMIGEGSNANDLSIHP
jgi:hypothetical protein